jgi:hypothetical protein
VEALVPDFDCTKLDPRTQDFYCRALAALSASGLPYLVGGAYAFARYTGIARHTKDLDVFVHRDDVESALAVLDGIGCHTEVTYPHWLGKAKCSGDFVDVIYSSGNGLARVDDEWFAHAIPDHVFDIPVRLTPPEEMIWSKAFVAERERYDGADVIHLLRACASELDWDRLMRRFDRHWRVLLSHLVLFGFVYPSERTVIPERVLVPLIKRLEIEQLSPAPRRVCRGTLLSRAQFLVDVKEWGYEDVRHDPDVHMTHEHIDRWTDAIAGEVRTHGHAQRSHSPGGGR